MRNRIIQVRHYSRKMMIMMLTGAICCSSCFCQTAFAKTSKVRVYDAEKGTTSFTSFTYSDNKKDESLAPSEGTGAISSASQKAVIFHQADGVPDNHGSAGGSVQPAHHVKQGGLAAARGSHNGHKLAVLHREVHAVKGAGDIRLCTVILFQVDRL